MMNFRTINAAIISILGAAAASRFTVTGYAPQGRAASEVRGSKRNVQSYFSQGDFPKSSGRAHGSTKHLMSFTLGLTVSAAASVNLTAINNPASTPQQITTALAAMQDAAFVADELMDELFELVYQILMDGRNTDLGLPIGTVTDCWLGALKKDGPIPQGALVVLTGEAHFSCSTSEEILGDEGVLETEGVTVTITMPGDTVQKTEMEA